MPDNIPTIQSGARFTPSQGARASEAVFGAPQAQANARLAAGLGVAANQLQQIAERQAALEDSKFVTEASDGIRQKISEWAADPENNQRVDFAQRLDEMFRQEASVLGTAPSQRAKQRLQAEISTFQTSQMRSALQRSAFNQEQDTLNTELTSAANSISIFRNDTLSGVPTAGSDFLGRYDNSISEINELYANQPQTRRRLSADVANQTILGLTDTNPVMALEVLNRSREFIDPKDAANHERRIGAATSVRDRAGELAFEDRWKTSVNDARADGTFEVIEPEEFTATYGPVQGASKLKEYQDGLTVATRTFGFRRSVEGMNTSAMTRAFDAAKEKLTNSPIDVETLESIKLVHDKMVKMAQEDPVAYLENSHDMVRSVLEASDKATTEIGKVATRRSANQMLKSFQGPAPDWITDPKERQLYHDLPTDQISLLSDKEAQEYADYLNDGSPRQLADKILELRKDFPDPEDFNIAMHDIMARAGDRSLAPGLAMVMSWYDETAEAQGKNPFPPHFQEWISALSPSTDSSLERVADSDMRTISSEIHASSALEKFRKGLAGSAGENLDLVGGVINTIAKVAKNKVRRGETPEDAVENAMKEGMYGFATIEMNEQIAVLNRFKADGTRYTDQDIEVIESNLIESMSRLNPDIFKTSQFPNLAELEGEFVTEASKERGKALAERVKRDLILNRGFWKPTKDGRSLVFKMLDSDGLEFTPTTIKNRELIVDLEEFLSIPNPETELGVGSFEQPIITQNPHNRGLKFHQIFSEALEKRGTDVGIPELPALGQASNLRLAR